MRSRPERPRLISTQRKDPLHEAFVACQPAQRAITTPTISPTPRYTMSGHNATLHVECRTAAHKNDLDPLKNVSTNRDMHTSLPHPLLPKLFRFNDTINSHPRPSHNALSPTQTPTLRTISQITIEDPSAFNRSNTADQIRRSFDALVKASPIALATHRSDFPALLHNKNNKNYNGNTQTVQYVHHTDTNGDPSDWKRKKTRKNTDNPIQSTPTRSLPQATTIQSKKIKKLTHVSTGDRDKIGSIAAFAAAAAAAEANKRKNAHQTTRTTTTIATTDGDSCDIFEGGHHTARQETLLLQQQLDSENANANPRNRNHPRPQQHRQRRCKRAAAQSTAPTAKVQSKKKAPSGALKPAVMKLHQGIGSKQSSTSKKKTATMDGTTLSLQERFPEIPRNILDELSSRTSFDLPTRCGYCPSCSRPYMKKACQVVRALGGSPLYPRGKNREMMEKEKGKPGSKLKKKSNNNGGGDGGGGVAIRKRKLVQGKNDDDDDTETDDGKDEMHAANRLQNRESGGNIQKKISTNNKTVPSDHDASKSFKRQKRKAGQKGTMVDDGGLGGKIAEVESEDAPSVVEDLFKKRTGKAALLLAQHVAVNVPAVDGGVEQERAMREEQEQDGNGHEDSDYEWD